MENESATLPENDIERAHVEMNDFLQSEIKRIVGLLSDPEHHISSHRISAVMLQLENQNTVEIVQPEFTIHRAWNNGFSLAWHDQGHQQHAA